MKNRILGKFVKNVLFVVHEVCIASMVFPGVCAHHFLILSLRCYRKRQPRQDEEPREIQIVINLTVEPTPKEVVSSIK